MSVVKESSGVHRFSPFFELTAPWIRSVGQAAATAFGASARVAAGRHA
jgi:hypothetical protein